MKEEWKDIVGYEGLYQVSTLGRVKSNPRNGTINNTRILKLKTESNGYLRVCLSKNNKKQSYGVHRLVYETFVGPIPEGMQVNHINEDKTDNRVSNLNLMTPLENTNWGTGIRRRADKIKRKIEQYTKEGELVGIFDSLTLAEKVFDFDKRNIHKCLKGDIPTAYGYVWKYA
jgi:hypothetical protein